MRCQIAQKVRVSTDPYDPRLRLSTTVPVTWWTFMLLAHLYSDDRASVIDRDRRSGPGHPCEPCRRNKGYRCSIADMVCKIGRLFALGS